MSLVPSPRRAIIALLAWKELFIGVRVGVPLKVLTQNKVMEKSLVDPENLNRSKTCKVNLESIGASALAGGLVMLTEAAQSWDSGDIAFETLSASASELRQTLLIIFCAVLGFTRRVRFRGAIEGMD